MPHVLEDPLFISARREALIVLTAWFLALIWSVSYCYSYGYVSDLNTISDSKSVEVRRTDDPQAMPELWVDRGRGPERVQFLLGFPSWIFWGVVLPWFACTVFSLYFGAFLVRDEDLGADIEAADEPHAEPEHHQGVQHA
jgi:hypothetical protein